MEAPGCLIFCILTPCKALSICFCFRIGSSFCLNERPLLFRAYILLWLFCPCAAFNSQMLSFIPPTCSCASSLLLHLFHVAPANSTEPPLHGDTLTIPTTAGVGFPGSRFTGPRERPACCVRVRWPLHTASEPVLQAAYVSTISSSSPHRLSASIPLSLLVVSEARWALEGCPKCIPSSGSTSGFWEAQLCPAVSRTAQLAAVR